MIKLSMGYPQIEDEVAIMKSRLENGKNTQFSACVLEKGDIEGIREEVAGIYVDDSIYEYVAKIAAKTRSRENIIQGVSPRGSIAVIAMAKAEAFLRGNNYVLPLELQVRQRPKTLIFGQRAFFAGIKRNKAFLQKIGSKFSIGIA